jgi:hypothetical protein
MRVARKFVVVAAFAVAAVCAPPRALADAKKECAAAYVDAQKLKRDGGLKEARERLIVCARDECISAVKKDCLSWLDEVNAALPSIVVVAKDASGKETLEVKVTVDGQLMAEKLDTNGIELDPGTHKLRFELEGEDSIEQEVILRAGQKNKAVEIQFGSGAPKAATDDAVEDDESMSFDSKDAEKRNVPTVSYVLAGVGVVALAGTAFFWLGSESEKSDLESSGCSPNCSQDDVDSIAQKRLFGDIALGVGVVSLGAAAYFWLAPGRKKAVPAEAAQVDVILRDRGAFATVRGAF